MIELNREIIYAISQMKEFERFLDSKTEYYTRGPPSSMYFTKEIREYMEDKT